ncbi:exocyst complex component Sec10-domain-containing protein [Limtongia smithiae]|uniref:exocyst complex component Sec10-domain-containing protein n=1 Tax=Limtongia smithiae TaxID=1125753 RepID=UPI0034CFAD1A
MAALYTPDQDTRQLLSVDTFLKQITVQDFIGKLVHDHAIQESNTHGPTLNPKPYIRTFEESLNELDRIDHELSVRGKKIQAETRHAEAAHYRTVAATESQCHTLVNQFSDLDLLVSDVASTTTTLGEAVDLVSRQRNRAASSSFIIKTYMAYLENDTSEVEKMRTGSLEDQKQCAVTIRQLLRISRKINNIPKAQIARQNIEKYAEMLEREMLKTFDRAYRAQDMNYMKAIAEILTEFNGGSSVVQIFVNQHDFFIMKDKLLHEAVVDNNGLWQNLCDPNCTNPPFDPATDELLDEIRSTVRKELIIIKRAFPHPDSVLRVFLQRLFAQTIQQRIELILSHAKGLSTLAYLRTLQIAHSRIGAFVEDLKGILTEGGLETSNGLAMLLDQNMQDVFVPYIENRQYIDTEKRNLKELAAVMLVRFNNYHFQRKTPKNHKLLDRFGSGSARDRWGTKKT